MSQTFSLLVTSFACKIKRNVKKKCFDDTFDKRIKLQLKIDFPFTNFFTFDIELQNWKIPAPSLWSSTLF